MFELTFAIPVVEDTQLARHVGHAAELLMRFAHIFGIEVAHAAATPVNGVLPREVGHEATEVFNPRIILMPVEQVYCLLVCLHR